MTDTALQELLEKSLPRLSSEEIKEEMRRWRISEQRHEYLSEMGVEGT